MPDALPVTKPTVMKYWRNSWYTIQLDDNNYY